MQNPIKYVKQLETVGLTRDQAEAHIQIMTEIMDTHFATKQDLKEALKEFESRMDVKFHNIDLRFSDLQNKIEQSEQRMTIKLGTIVSIAIGIAVTLAKIV